MKKYNKKWEERGRSMTFRCEARMNEFLPFFLGGGGFTLINKYRNERHGAFGLATGRKVFVT